MSVICRLFGHRPSDRMIWNDGFHFGRCTRCGCEIVRSKARWTSVPPGFRIVWRDRTAADIDWSEWRNRTFQAAIPKAADPDLKLVGEAAERRDPASPGHGGIAGGQRRGDRHAA